MGGLLDKVFGKPKKMKQTQAERDLYALGKEQLADYQDNYKPIMATVASKKGSRDDNRDLEGTANADAAQRAAVTMQQARRSFGRSGGGGMARAAVKSGTDAGMSAAIAKQQEEDVYVKDLIQGAGLGRNSQGMANAAMGNSAATQFKRDYGLYRDKAEQAERRFNVIGETIGMGMGAYAQSKSGQKSNTFTVDSIPKDQYGEFQFDP